MIKFVHIADIHLGVENYGKIDNKTGIHSRLLDFKKSLAECIDFAINEKVDFFLFCGDAYKTAFPTPTQQKFLMQEIFKLIKVGIPVISVVGNHDNPLSFGKINSLEILDYLPLNDLYVFSKPGVLKLETKNGPIQIVGIPWPTRNNIITDKKFHLKSNEEITKYISEAVTKIIQGLAQNLDKNIPTILAGHLTVSTGVFSGSEKCAVFGNDPVFLPSQLALPEFEYVALGHLHRYQNLNPKGYPAVVYPGSIERIDFGERKEEKGFCLVEIDVNKNGKKCNFEFKKIKTRSMIQLDIKLNDKKDQTEQILNAIKKQEIKDSILKIIYTVPDGKKDRVDLQEVQNACSDAYYLASIIPVRKHETREKRINVNVEMDIKTLLEKYLQTRDLTIEHKKEILKKAQNLYSDFYENQNQKDLSNVLPKKLKKQITL